MSKSPAYVKGNELENTVRAIENHILRSAPNFSEGAFKIESKRVVISDGVKHEIDIYVTASLAVGYEAIFIFECKNWEAKVGKNELIIFSEKISAVRAQKGFFVAKSFTRDAKAQASKDGRIQLLIASHKEPTNNIQFPQLLCINTIHTNADIKISGFEKGLFPNGSPIDLNGKSLIIAQKKNSASDFINKWIESIRDRQIEGLQISDMQNGNHCIEFSDQRCFDQGEAYLDDKNIKIITLSGKADLFITRGLVRSVFEVESRGRVITVDADSPGLEIRAEFIERLDEKHLT